MDEPNGRERDQPRKFDILRKKGSLPFNLDSSNTARDPTTGWTNEVSRKNGTFNFSETAFRSMDEKPKMLKSRRIDCVYYARTWNSFEIGKCCDKLEEQALVLRVDNGLFTLQYQRILEHMVKVDVFLFHILLLIPITTPISHVTSCTRLDSVCQNRFSNRI
ncbi:hypothetical protein AVEN_28449-1 [Araneus ventricosus]|uniref:Uncharacterized protein n=1 Tax=Araneus ventricosus TaxID=182803 RepID=A0A4Y2M6Y3_ARAVE|nr:hypothetical protein AVEN_28449-1 [Araneus ventricosus]